MARDSAVARVPPAGAPPPDHYHFATTVARSPRAVAAGVRVDLDRGVVFVGRSRVGHDIDDVAAWKALPVRERVRLVEKNRALQTKRAYMLNAMDHELTRAGVSSATSDSSKFLHATSIERKYVDRILDTEVDKEFIPLMRESDIFLPAPAVLAFLLE